jgi:hypothetical protein
VRRQPLAARAGRSPDAIRLERVLEKLILSSGQITFVLIALCGCGYVAIARRTFDLCGLAFLSCIVYYWPALIGVAVLPDVELRFSIIDEGTYDVLSIAAAMLLAATVVSDRMSAAQVVRGGQLPARLALADDKLVGPVALLVAVCALAVTLASAGDAISSTNKQELLERLGRSHIIFEFSASIATLVFIQSRKWLPAIPSVVLLAIDLALGFRTAAVTTLLAAVVLTARLNGPQRLIHRWKLGLLLASALISMMILKQFMFALRVLLTTGDPGLLLDQIGRPELYLMGIIVSEPSVVTAVLNEVVMTGYSLDASHFYASVLAFLPGGDLIGVGTPGFNDLYQRELFPDIDWGMAASFFAQWYALGGLPGTAAFCAVLATVIVIMSLIAARLDGTVQTAWLLAGVYLAFYSHRNDLIFQFLLERRVIGVYLALWVASALALIALRALAAEATSSNIAAERPV